MLTVYNNTLGQLALAPGAALTNGAHAGLAVDTQVFYNDFRDLKFVVAAGVITDGSHAVTVEESNASGSGFAAAANVLGTLPTITSTGGNTVYEVGVVPTKRYVRVVITTSGSTTGGLFAATASLANGRFGPVARS